MPKMRFFQPIARIKDHYNDVLREINSGTQYSHIQLKCWCVREDEHDLILEEQAVLKYILSCQRGMAYETNSKKPTLDVVHRCFTRTLAYLEKIFDCNASNVKKCKHEMVKKEFYACEYYLSKFWETEWYDKLPEEILTFANKYGDITKEALIPIPPIK